MLDHYMMGRLIDLWLAEDIGDCDLTGPDDDRCGRAGNSA